MKVYTKTGDTGTTSLVGGTRVLKNDPRLEAYGTVDELNSWLGFITAMNQLDKESTAFVVSIQNKLFNLGAALATEPGSKWHPVEITARDTEEVENEIDRLETFLPRHDKFILPGGTTASGALNIARTVCRRAERIMVNLPDGCCIGLESSLKFVNRLSDYLFVLSRYANHLAGAPETFWIP